MKIKNLSQAFILIGAIVLTTGIFLWKIFPGRSEMLALSKPKTDSNSTKNNNNLRLTPSTVKILDAKPKEWSKNLTKQQIYILRDKGTERPFGSELYLETRPGTYVSADCNEPVFRSEQKYDSGTGWPSFWAPINSEALVLTNDKSLFGERTEVLSKCGGHLGHVFDDGPAPTGKRYCINGDALIFIPDIEVKI